MDWGISPIIELNTPFILFGPLILLKNIHVIHFISSS